MGGFKRYARRDVEEIRISSFYWPSNQGTIVWTILDEFSENFRRGGGGVISDPNNFVADFSVILRGKMKIFREKRGGSLQSEKFRCKKCNIVFRNEGGGPFGVFPKIHPNLGTEASLIATKVRMFIIAGLLCII